MTLISAVSIAALACISLAADIDTGRTRLFKYLMGTSMRVEVYGGDAHTRQQAADEAFAAIAEVDRVMSDYRDDSELTRVNREADARPVPVSAPLFAVLDAAGTVARQSDGAFDVTMRPLGALWGLRSPAPRVPSAAELTRVRPLVGFRGLQLDVQAHTVHFARAGMSIDLDGVAKGFASELAAKSLRRRGLAGVVDTGGHQYMVGLPPGKSSWSIGIGHPFQPGTLLGSLDIHGGAVSTTAAESSDGPGRAVARRVLDPRTLQPSAMCVSATVVSPDGTTAQALSHAACVMGSSAGLALFDRFADTWGIVAYRAPDGSVGVRVSPGHVQDFHPLARRD